MIQTEEKFLFHLNVFDVEKDEIAEEDLIPPPPVFSEDELHAAQKKSYEDGRKQGEADEKSKRSQHLTQIMESLSKNTQGLFEAESSRETLFEREALAVSLAIFNRLFPETSEQNGFTELQAAILRVLERHTGKQSIAVFVQPDYVEDIEKFLKTLQDKNNTLSFSVAGDETLTFGASRMRWADGGAIRDTGAIAEEIAEILKQTLADDATKGDDAESGLSYTKEISDE